MPKVTKEHSSKVTGSNKRKRKPTKRKMETKKSKNESNQIRWDLSADVTAEIFEEMGVSTLEDESCDHVFKDEPMQESRAQRCRTAPKIPQPGQSSVGTMLSDAMEECSIHNLSKSCEPHGDDPFAKLSDEILLNVFKWLPKTTLSKCALVCKRWRDLSYDDSLWKRVDLSKKYLKPGVLGQSVERGVIVLRLAMATIMDPFFHDAHQKRTIMNHERFCKLQYLDLSMTSISLETLRDLFSVCSQLKKVSLEQCALNDDICRHLSNNRSLEVLNMSMCRGLEAEGIQCIASNCRSLQSWNLAWVYLSSESMTTLCMNLPSSLKRLNISGHREVLTDNHVSKIAGNCPNLVELDVSDSTQLSGISFDVLIRVLPRLQALHCSRCYNIPADSYLDLVSMKSLRCLTVYAMMNETLIEVLRQRLPHAEINKKLFSEISRPTIGIRRTSVWELRVRD